MHLRTLGLLTSALAFGTALSSAHAVGRLVDVQVVDRGTGETLTPIRHDGEWWIAGRPGARYGVVLANRDGRRTLNVVSIDGVNAVSGDTAAWDQTGYVLNAGQDARIDGWRKNATQVAAFEFTALPDSYAARTGRPANVGVIGIATFTERRPAPVLRPQRSPAPGDASASPASTDEVAGATSAASSADSSSLQADPSAARAAPAPAPQSAREERSADMALRRDRLGTGHGEIEASSIRYVGFQRAHSTPDEVVTIRYDRVENLIAMGVLPRPSLPPIAASPAPFPGNRFVADPPPRR